MDENTYIKKATSANDVFEIIESVVSALVIVIFLLSFIFRVVSVHGTSMVPTFENFDKVIISDLFFTPKTGDVVVLDSEIDTSTQTNIKTLIKRIIATEGQTIDIDRQTGEVTVDGVLLQEDYIKEMIAPEKVGDHNYPLIIPEGKVFVMGDNRNGSSDSRFSYIGLIDERYIIGKVHCRILPIDSFKWVN